MPSTAALERVGCECDPTDLRPDLLPSDGSVVAIFVENHQDPYAEDPDYDIWSYALMADGTVRVHEHKNHWKVTTEACLDSDHPLVCGVLDA